MKNTYKALAVIFLILLIDQTVKILVKTNMTLYESFTVFGTWGQIYFIENEGMAFGLQYGGSVGKIFLSVFRIIAVFGIGYYLFSIIRKPVRAGLVVALAMIFAGAMGNIIDSVFYGVIFSASEMHGPVAQLFPAGGGYAGLLHGKVVDMLYLPLVDTYLPNWIPIVGGNHFQFFQPIFNVADSAITIGLFMIILFHKRYFDGKFQPKLDHGHAEEEQPAPTQPTVQEEISEEETGEHPHQEGVSEV